jgi:hypothetical protein
LATVTATKEVYMMTLLTGAVLAAALGTTAVAYATRLATTSIFQSTTVTATGSAQNVAHGLGATPRLYWIVPRTFAAGEPSQIVNSVDATNVNITVGPAGSTVIVIAIL